MWFKVILTSCALAVVLYFQFFFDIKSFVAQGVDEEKPAEMEKLAE